jgi:hypothetical protein
MTEPSSPKKARRAVAAPPAEPVAAASEHEVAADPSPLARAERVVDHLTQRAGTFAAVAARTTMRFAALVREEAEDILAEAHEVRRQHSTGRSHE